VAAYFGKRHANVLQSIDTLECSPEFRQLNFQSAEYLDGQGKPRPSIDMTKDGFVFLVMGFTGRKAAAFKEAYIGRFNEMEAELRPAEDGQAQSLHPWRQVRWSCRDGANRCSGAALGLSPTSSPTSGVNIILLCP